MENAPQRMDEQDVEAALVGLTGWELRDGKLYRAYVFDDFVEAMGFIARAAIWAEKLNHHPEWSNLYRTVEVALETHDVDGISSLDIELATQMNRLAGQPAT